MFRLRILGCTLLIAGLWLSGCQKSHYLPLALKQAAAPAEPTPSQAVKDDAPADDANARVAVEVSAPTPTLEAKILLPLLSKPAKQTPAPWLLIPKTMRGSRAGGQFILELMYPLVNAGTDLRMKPLQESIQGWLNEQIARFLENTQSLPEGVFEGYLLSTYSFPNHAAWDAGKFQPDYQRQPAILSGGEITFDGGHPVLSILLSTSEYFGGAHGLERLSSINYDLELGRTLELADLFTPGTDYLGRLSELSILELERRPDLLPEQFKQGAAPNAQNFRTWSLTEQGIIIFFEEYQVGPYASGHQIILIPYDRLHEILRPGGPLENYLN